MAEAKIGKSKVVDAVTRFQCFVNSIEKRNNGIAGLDVHGPEVVLHRLHGIEIGESRAAEMNPVNAPGFGFVTAVRMFFVLRQNKKFIGAYFKTFVIEFVPAMPVHAKKEKVFRQAFFAVGVMASCLRIITQAGDVKRLKQFIVLNMRFQNGLRNFDSLPAGAVPDVFIGTFFGDYFHAEMLTV